MNNVLAVVVTYNRLDKLKKCLAALRSSDKRCDVLVVDNASTDGTSDWLPNIHDEGFSFLRSDKNVGGAGGFNIGVRESVSRGYKYVWLMDDDCMVHADSLSKLIEADEVPIKL